MNKNIKIEKRNRRHKKIRSRVSGTNKVPRLSVFKSNTNVYAQLIDDVKMATIVSASSKKAEGKTLLERAKNTGKEIAQKAIEKKISKVVFDRGGFIYTGRIKAIADGAREGGLKF